MILGAVCDKIQEERELRRAKMIKHIVIWKFRENEEENMRKFLGELNRLKDIIPEIKSMETGININPKNEYDAILISEFETMEDLERYKTNPEHVKVSGLCKKIRVDRQAIDYEIAQFSCPPLTGIHEFNTVFLKGTGSANMVKKLIP